MEAQAVNSVKFWIVAGALACCCTLAVGMVCYHALRRYFRQMGAFGVVLLLGFLYCMATKPTITWDTYLADNGSHFTNDYAKVVFKWKKTLATLPNATPVTIEQKPTGGTTWTPVGTSTVGAGTYELAIASTNFAWAVYCDYVPPTPVHTNGVWLGQIIEKAKGDTGLNRLVIINAQLIKNGKVIAP